MIIMLFMGFGVPPQARGVLKTALLVETGERLLPP